MASHKIMTLPVDEIFADFDRNFRDPDLDYSACLPTEGYDRQKFLAGKIKQGLFEDILENGVQTPIWVSLLTADQIEQVFARTGKHYRARVIRGHKRYRTVQEINTRFPGKITELTVDAYSGLSETEEWELLADHGETKREEPLSELGQYRAAVNLFAAGFSQERIGNLFGQKRGWAMRRVWVHQMGQNTPIETHYLARFNPKAEKGTFYTFPLSDVDKLHTAYSADTEAGRSPMDDDAAFRKLWDTYAETGRQPREEKSLTRKAIDERAPYVKGRPALEEMVKFASGRGGNAKQAAEMYDRLEAKAKRVETIEADLVAERAKTGDLTARLEANEARIAELTAENAALRAELTEARKPHATPKNRR